MSEQIDQILADMTKLDAAMRRLRARVSELEEDQTADGVPVADCDTIWMRHPEGSDPMPFCGVVYDLRRRRSFCVYRRAEYPVALHGYSTRAAAEAAKGGCDG